VAEDSQFIYLVFNNGMYGIKLMNSSQVAAVEAMGNIAVVPLDSDTFTNLNVKKIFDDAAITVPASMELGNVVIMQSMAAKRGRVSSSEGMSVRVDYLRLIEAGNQFDYSYCPLP
jgi:ABC-type proline/glycine betaine transport system substrate-binding protein